jgi:hypothetical protein
MSMSLGIGLGLTDVSRARMAAWAPAGSFDYYVDAAGRAGYVLVWRVQSMALLMLFSLATGQSQNADPRL